MIGTVEPADSGPTRTSTSSANRTPCRRILDGEAAVRAARCPRIRVCVPGDARYNDVAAAHTARVTMVECSTALITLARKMQEHWGIPFFEGSFYGISDTSDALRNTARLLVERGAAPDLIARTEALIEEEERAPGRASRLIARCCNASAFCSTPAV